MYDRVGGVLAVSRSFGDHSLRGFGVIATPDVISVDLRIIHKYLIVATDGLWDVITPKVHAVPPYLPLQQHLLALI